LGLRAFVATNKDTPYFLEVLLWYSSEICHLDLAHPVSSKRNEVTPW